MKEKTTKPTKIKDAIKSLKVGETYTRHIKTEVSNRMLISQIKSDPDFKHRTYSVYKDRENDVCIITRKN